jgi:hypothetical protein
MSLQAFDERQNAGCDTKSHDTEGVTLSARRMTATLDQVIGAEHGLVSILPAHTV